MPALSKSHREAVLTLAKLHGLTPSFVDAFGVRRRASTDSMIRVLAALGSEAATPAEARASLRARRAAMRAPGLEPVTVAWEGKRAAAWLRPSGSKVRGGVRCSLALESGEITEWEISAAKLRIVERAGVDGKRERRARIDLPRQTPAGYHTLRVELDGERFESLVISSPVKAFRFPREDAGKRHTEWGLFCPVYAIRTGSDLGIGDLTSLRELATWSAGLGGRVVATLPLLAASLTEPFDPSPYAPVSRVFWNELFADLSRAPEFTWHEESRELAHAATYLAETNALREAELVDYRRVAVHKRRLLETLARRFFASGGERSEAFAAFRQRNPLVDAYARFRATTERQGRDWSEWPARLRRGPLREGDYDEAARRYHLYAQYLLDRQLDELTDDLHERGALVYLDLPVGVSPYGFDVWRNQGLFALGCATGAPPDPYFSGGQNWGFPPMKPDAMRAEGFATFIAALRAHMARADYLRLDHVMAFHRLFWIPDDGEPADGLYVRYPAEELYAILCLESHRNQCRLVGENLGTVPPEVNTALDRHDLCGLYVAQYEMQPSAARALRPAPANCVASVNTHDMPPFAKQWDGSDIDDRIALGLLSVDRRNSEHRSREKTNAALVKFLSRRGLTPSATPDAGEVRDAVLTLLAQSPADFVLINIEDLWLETAWQNVPGTEDEHPNWRRRLRFTMDELRGDSALAAKLRWIDALRRGQTPRAPASKPSEKPRGSGKAAVEL